MTEVDCFQAITDLEDNNPSKTSVTGRVQQPRLITTVAVGLLGLPWKLFWLPISIIGGSVGLVTRSIGLSFRVVCCVLSYPLSMVGLRSSNRSRKTSSTPPVSASVSTAAEASGTIDFVSEFESRYGEIHPNFFSGDFMDAVERSRCECKLLFVYLHSPDNPDTPSFCKLTLCSEFLSAFVNENFVSWGDSIWKIEGLEMSKSLKASRFPFSAVIKVATDEGFSLLRQFEGPSSPEEMVTELQSVLEENAPALVVATVDTTDEHTNNTPLMEEQQADPYPAALEADRGNEFQREEDQNRIVTDAESEAKLYEEEASQLVPEVMVTELDSVLDVTSPALVATSVDTSDEHTNNPPLMEEQDTPYPAELDADQGNEFQKEEDQSRIETEAESEDKLCEEEASMLVLEEMVTEIDSVHDVNSPALVAASVDTSDEHTNNPPLMEAQDTPYPAELEADQGNEFQSEEDQNRIETEGESEDKLCEAEASMLVLEEMVTELDSVHDVNFPALVAASVDTTTTDEHTNNPPLMEEQDTPYPATVEADQADEESQREKDENGMESEASLLVPEPEPEPGSVIQVFVRLPIGERIGRRFPSSATLQSVYDFVDSSGWLDVGSYSLVTFFPRVIYGQQQLSLTLEQLGLKPQTSLFVELHW